MRASGNKDVCVKMAQTNRGHRLGPLNLPVEEEVESQYLKYIVNLPQGVKYSQAVERFNANVSYSGLNHAVSQEVCVMHVDLVAQAEYVLTDTPRIALIKVFCSHYLAHACKRYWQSTL